ncbi:hypothetical protein CBL_09671 [Carabus blaptoides fortunei]
MKWLVPFPERGDKREEQDVAGRESGRGKNREEEDTGDGKLHGLHSVESLPVSPPNGRRFLNATLVVLLMYSKTPIVALLSAQLMAVTRWCWWVCIKTLSRHQQTFAHGNNSGRNWNKSGSGRQGEGNTASERSEFTGILPFLSLAPLCQYATRSLEKLTSSFSRKHLLFPDENSMQNCRLSVVLQ